MKNPIAKTEPVVPGFPRSFFAPGKPVAQGSKRHVGGGRMIESAKALKPWRESVGAAYLSHYAGREPLTGALSLRLEFLLRYPKSGSRVCPSVRPDLDKYCRAVMDALTLCRAYLDDGQVVKLHAEKAYSYTSEGVSVRICPWEWESRGAVIRAAGGGQ